MVVIRNGRFISRKKTSSDEVHQMRSSGSYGYELKYEILLHMGIDTVEMAGKPFELAVKDGDHVKHGQVLANVDLEMLKAAGKDTAMMVIVTNMDSISNIELTHTDDLVKTDVAVAELTLN